MAGASLGQGSTPVLAINFCLYLIAACLAGWALNRNFDAQNGPGDGGVGAKVVEAFIIILSLFELLYLLSLHLGFGRAHLNHGAAPIATGTGMGGMGGHNHNHHTDYGHHTDVEIPFGHVASPAHPTY